MKNLRIIITMLLVVLFNLLSLIHADNLSANLSEIVLQGVENLRHLKDAPEGLKFDNYVKDNKGYYWYINCLETKGYSLMCYDGFESHIIKQIDNHGYYQEYLINDKPKAYKMSNGNLVFFTPNKVILVHNYQVQVHDLLKDDILKDVFHEENKILLLGYKGYYVIEKEEFKIFKHQKQVSDLPSTYFYYNGPNKLENISNPFKIRFNRESRRDDLDISQLILTADTYLLAPNLLFDIYHLDNYLGARVVKRELIPSDIQRLRNRKVTFGNVGIGDLFTSEEDKEIKEEIKEEIKYYYLRMLSHNEEDSIIVAPSKDLKAICESNTNLKLWKSSDNNYFFYIVNTNYLYSISTVEKKCQKIELPEEYKIIDFICDGKTDRAIYQKKDRIYFSEFTSFSQGIKDDIYYTLTKQEKLNGVKLYIHSYGKLFSYKISSQIKENDNKPLWQKSNENELVKFLILKTTEDKAELSPVNPNFSIVSNNKFSASKNNLISSNYDPDKRIAKIEFFNVLTHKNDIKYYFLNEEIEGLSFEENNNRLILFFGNYSVQNTLITRFSPQLKKMTIPKDKFSSLESVRRYYARRNTYSQHTDYIYSVTDNFVLAIQDKFPDWYLHVFRIGKDSLSRVLTLDDNNFPFFDNKKNYLYFSSKRNGNSIVRYSLEDEIIDSLGIVNSGNFYYDSYNNMLHLLDNQILSQYDLSKTPVEKINSVAPFFYDFYSSDRIIEDSLIVVYDDNGIKVFNIQPKKKSKPMYYLSLVSKDSTAFALHKKKLDEKIEYRVSKFVNGKIVELESDYIHLTNNPNEVIYLTKSDNYYYILHNNTIYYYDNNHWNYLYEGNNFYSNHFDIFRRSLFIEDITDKFLIYNSKSLILKDKKSGLTHILNNRKEITNFIHTVFVTPQKDIFVYLYNKEFFKFDRSLFKHKLDISWVDVNNKIISLESDLKLPANSKITFPVALLNCQFPEDYEIRYKLEGYNEDWNTVDFNGKISYNNIPPGDYTFHVQAIDSEINDNKISLDFEVLPKAKWSLWIYAVFVISFVLFIYIVIKLNLKKGKP
ncbi:hypothetical protein JEZ13_04600 [bacterium]|nr:hypothetical protein [bacterium]